MRIFLLLLFFSFSVLVSQSQTPAFPGAEGAGEFTSGGRGTNAASTTVFAVTSLADDGTTTTKGTIRWALYSAAAYRTVIFRVSGTIHLVAPLKITKPNTTIAGQTAPGDGICIADYPVSVSADNVIVRYIRFRMGDRYQNKGMVDGSGSDDALGGTGRSNIIIDHCTMSWSTDEACSFYNNTNFTLQWNILSEPLNYSYHFETGDTDFEHHGYGGIWGGVNATFHHNLIAHCQGRNPRFDGSRNLGDGKTPGLENVDFRNNVIYNWGAYTVNGGEGGNYNIVNNYYKYGPNTSGSSSSGVPIRAMIINPFKNTDLPYGKYFVSGNYVQGNTAITNNNWSGAAMSGGTFADTTLAKVVVPFALPGITTETALQAFQSVMKSAGCVLPARDTLDQRIINNVLNRTGRIIDVQGGYPHGTAYNLTVNAWPALLSKPAPLTTNTDSIPDEWLAQRNLTGKALSGSGGYHTNGYTHIENFLNGDSIVAFGKMNNCVTARPITSVNTGKWIDAKDSTFSRLISSDTNNVVASVLDNGTYGNFEVSYYTTGTMRYDPDNHPYLSRNVTIKPLGTVTTPVTIRIYFTEAEYNALKAVDPAINSPADLCILNVGDPDYLCNTTMITYASVITPTAYGTYGTYKTGYYLEFTTSDFSNFFIGSKTYFPVPVNVSAFNATVFPGQKVQLNWTTQNEINFKKFIVEKSSDGKNFAELESVEPHNNSLNNYSVEDGSNISGVLYYRLKLVDHNGAFTYSKTIIINVKRTGILNVYPVPADNRLTVNLPESDFAGVIRLLSTDGRIVLQSDVRPHTTSVSLDISKLSGGTYFLKSINNNNCNSVKFVKQ